MNVRDWLYVRDHAEALWQVLTRGQNAETYLPSICEGEIVGIWATRH